MAVITTYPTKETPAPRFEGEKIAQELKRLLDEVGRSPELCFVTEGNHYHPGRRLVKSKCRVHSDGSIHLVARIARGCACPHNEEQFYFSLARELMPMNGKRITTLIAGYPSWEVSIVIENTHLGIRTTYAPGKKPKQEDIAPKVKKAS